MSETCASPLLFLLATNRQKMSNSIASIAVSFWSSDTEIIFKYNSLFCPVTRNTKYLVFKYHNILVHIQQLVWSNSSMTSPWADTFHEHVDVVSVLPDLNLDNFPEFLEHLFDLWSPIWKAFLSKISYLLLFVHVFLLIGNFHYSWKMRNLIKPAKILKKIERRKQRNFKP